MWDREFENTERIGRVQYFQIPQTDIEKMQFKGKVASETKN